MGIGSLGICRVLTLTFGKQSTYSAWDSKKKKKKVTLGPKELRLYSVLQSKKKNLFNAIY